jgi:hypothetical protein
VAVEHPDLGERAEDAGSLPDRPGGHQSAGPAQRGQGPVTIAGRPAIATEPGRELGQREPIGLLVKARGGGLGEGDRPSARPASRQAARAWSRAAAAPSVAIAAGIGRLERGSSSRRLVGRVDRFGVGGGRDATGRAASVDGRDPVPDAIAGRPSAATARAA